MSSALETVPHTPDGLDVLGITADIAELFTYLLNVYRYGGDITHGLHSPDGPEQVVLGIDLVGILCKKCKQIEFLGGEDLLFSVYKNSPGTLIDPYASNFDGTVLLLPGAGTHKTLILSKIKLSPTLQLS